MSKTTDISDIQAHEGYKEGSKPDHNSSESFVFVLTESTTPESFFKRFKGYYKKKYDNKKLVLLHCLDGHWITYECDYKYDPNSELLFKTHSICPDGRCGLHAVAKALEIVGNKKGLVVEKSYGENNAFQIPSDVVSDNDQIFEHLGLDKIELRAIRNKSSTRNLTGKISSLQDPAAAEESWLDSEDIDNILIHTSIKQQNGAKIFLASMIEYYKFNTSDCPDSGVDDFSSLIASSCDEQKSIPFSNIKKLNSIDCSRFDKAKLEKLKYLKVLVDNDGDKVEKIVIKKKGSQEQIDFEDFDDDARNKETAFYSEYVKYADRDRESSKKDVMDFFALQPKKYWGYGLKIRLDANGILYYVDCFNDNIERQFKEIEKGSEIFQINGKTIKEHIEMAKKLEIKPEHYINSLFRSDIDEEINLQFSGNKRVQLRSENKMAFEEHKKSHYQALSEYIDVKQKMAEADKLMIAKSEEELGSPEESEKSEKHKGDTNKALEVISDRTKEVISDRTKKTHYEAVIQHIDKRFEVLKEIIKKKKPKVIIFAKDESKAEKHSLGTGIAQQQWGDENISKSVTQYIENKIQELERYPDCEPITYKFLKFENSHDLQSFRGKTLICRGPIYCTKECQPGEWTDHDFTDKFPPGNEYIHVWGANVDNFNLKDGDKINGGGQAGGIGDAHYGKFGIVTTDHGLTQSNLSKLMEKDLIYEATAATSIVKDKDVPGSAPFGAGAVKTVERDSHVLSGSG